MENLAKAYEKFFKKTADHPVFKKKGKSADSFRFPETRQFTVDQENSLASRTCCGENSGIAAALNVFAGFI
jgi:hypothetical protein